MHKEPATKKNRRIKPVDNCLLELLKSEDTTKILAQQMDRVLTFAIQANNPCLTFAEDSEEDDFFTTLKKRNIHPNNSVNRDSIAWVIKVRQQRLHALINGSYLPDHIKKKFRTTLDIRNEREYYQQVALVTGTAIVFAFAPICFALAATGHPLFAAATAMVGIGSALMAYSNIKNKALITYAFDALDGPQRNSKAFTQWIGSLNSLVTETLPKVKVPKPQIS